MNKENSSWLDKCRQVLKTHTSLIVIILAAVLVELTSAVMYYSAQNIIQQTVERLVNREMNAIYLCIRNKLAKVEVTIDNMAWVVNEDLAKPDEMFLTTRLLVEHNPSMLGGGVAFVPGYYHKRSQFFEPYAVRKDNDSIISIQLGADGVDHTNDEYFQIPTSQGKAHWSEPYMDPDGAGTVVTTYSVPVHDDNGQIVGIVYADISLEWLDEVMNESILYNSTQRFLVTGEGHLLSGKDNYTYRAVRNLMETDNDSEGYLTMTGEKGEKQHVFYHPVGGMTDWVLISILNDNEVFGRLRNVRRMLAWLVIAGLVLIGFIIWRTSRNLERLRAINAEKERIDGELQVANQIQQSMLPQQHHHRDDVDIFGVLVPAREVGGDLFDYFIRDEKLFFCIGDVSGKGAASAMLMGVTHALFRSSSAHENSPARIMQAINEASCRGNDSNMFVTLFIGVLDLPTGHLRYCNAGHDAPLISEKTAAEGENAQPAHYSLLPVIAHLPIGVFDDVKYGEQETYLPSGGYIFLYTDGVTEAMNEAHQLFGIERVEALLNRCAQQPLVPQQILEAFGEEVKGFVGNAPQSDDITMLAIQYTPQHIASILTETLTIKNDVHEVTRFSTFMKSVTDALGIENSMSRQLRLAVEEAVVNIIDYAYPSGKEGAITIRINSDGHLLRCQITDSGVAFDPTAKEKADTSLSAEDRRIGGLGILLVRELMDSINYERINGQNVLTLTKKFS